MRYILPAFIFLFSLNSALFAQDAPPKPLTQTEYVRMLYVLEKNPAAKDELIQAIRTRGIGFELTDGLRGLTRTKGRNDAELQRTLEESERRRVNPSAAKLPSEEEAREILEKTRRATMAAVADMPDFTVKELINRGISYAGTNNFKSYDKLVIAVNYSATRGEQYRVLAVNGELINAAAGSNYSGLDGATTGGEFVENLEKIFKPESKTQFELVDTDMLRDNQAVIYEYFIALENNKSGGVSYATGVSRESVDAAQKGRIWIDRNKFRVLRIEFQLTEIPPSFPVKAFKSSTDFDWQEIGGEKHLLPVLSDARFTALTRGEKVETRNLIRFKNYQKYGTEVQVLDEDVEEVVPDASETSPQTNEDEPPPIRKP